MSSPREPLRAGGRGNARVVLGVLAVFGAVFFLAPMLGLLSRASWSDLAGQLGAPGVRDALWISLIVSMASLGASLAVGLPLAWVLARYTFPGRRILRAIVTLPMVLPPVVAGVALLAALGRRGPVGELLFDLGIELPFTAAGAVVAATFVSAPFLIATVEAGLTQLDRRLEAAAATLGANQWRILWTVVVPGIRPSLLAGAALCWARALGEFGATITFAGNLQARTQTLPLAVYETLQTDHEGAIAISLVLLAVSLAVLVSLRGRWSTG